MAGRLGSSQPAYAKDERYHANPSMRTVDQLGQVLSGALLLPAPLASRVPLPVRGSATS